MTSDSRWRRTEELYHAALERPESERAAFLLAACDDDALRRDVESLLAQAGVDQFLTTPAIELAGRGITASNDVLIGRRVGSYEILSLLGAGGMGVVYRARDTKLQREVAIKVLPDTVAADPDRIARFAREARLLAALNHPNIATIYGLEEGDGVSALVLELVDGETLTERLARGRLTSTEAMQIAKQIADGLEAAHDRGIVHRDLKPSNITLRADGNVKILDFGLAKALATAPDNPAAPLTHRSSPTLVGVVTGTPAYMSPEQAQGQPVDKRTDIWAFGCVLFEMLTGQQAFAGRSIGETFAAVIAAEPAWEALPPKTPPAVRSLLRHCLQKEPARRLRDITDGRFQLDEMSSDSDDRTRIASRARTATFDRALWAAGVLVAIAAGVAGGVWWVGRAPVDPRVVEINTPPTRNWSSLAISPDGTKVTFVGISDGRSRLWVRSLETGSADQLKGTENAAFPFWSPNSRSIGFFADGQLKRIDVDSGAVQVIARDAAALGGTWNEEGTILFASGPGSPLSSISAEGRNRTQETPVSNLKLNSARFPHFLPDGRHFLFYALGTEAGIYVGQLGALNRDPPRRLVPDAQAPTYASSGHLLFVRQGTLFAQPFDANRLKLAGEPTSIAERLVVTIDPGSAALSVSQAGHVVYRTRPPGAQHEFVWFDRLGKEIETIPGSEIGSGFNSSLSPAENQLAIGDNSTGTTDIWLLDILRGVPNKFTFHDAFDLTPVWSPKSDWIAFASNRRAGTDFDLYRRSTEGGEEERLIATDGEADVPSDWSRDGRFILYTRGRGSTDMWALSVEDHKSVSLVKTGANEANGRFSSDVRWIAYQSNKSGQFEIYVEPFQRGGSEDVVSIGGGVQVQWREDGTELFYLAPDDRLMVVSVRRDPAADKLHFGKPIELFATHPAGATRQGFNRHYSVSRDGQRFLIHTLRQTALPITVVLNWKPAS